MLTNEIETPIAQNFEPEVESLVEELVEEVEQKPEAPPEAELELETQEIIWDLIADSKFDDNPETELEPQETDNDREKKIRKLHNDTSVWRSQALYRLGISVHIGRGASNINIKFEDILEMSETVKKAVKKSQVRTTIPVAKGVQVLRNKLYGQRQKILDKYFVEFGGELVVPQENFQQVLAEIKELYELLEVERRKAIASSRHDLRVFLTRIGRLCDVNGFEGDKKRKILKYYKEVFPTVDEIKRICITVSEPKEIPSFKDMILGDSELAKAEADRAVAKTQSDRERAEQQKIKADVDAVREIKRMAQEQVKRQWQETYNSINQGFLSLVEQQLNQLMNDRREMSGDQRRNFAQALGEMQKFLVGGDQTLQELMTQVEGLGQFVEGTGSADWRRQQLDKRIEDIRNQFSEKFIELKTTGKGHRVRALENFSIKGI